MIILGKVKNSARQNQIKSKEKKKESKITPYLTTSQCFVAYPSNIFNESTFLKSDYFIYLSAFSFSADYAKNLFR
jgi:hypothetical protein